MSTDITPAVEETDRQKAAGKARHLGRSIVRGAIASLKATTDCLLSGDDSNLENVWEEVCVQVQGEHSFEWEVYLDMIDCLIETAVDAATPDDLRYLWLETENGQEWEYDGEGKNLIISEPQSIPVFQDDIVDDLRSRLLRIAADDESENVRDYLDGGEDGEDIDEDEDEDMDESR